jgi:hypothetical protein
MIRNQIWRVSRFVIVATGLTTALSITDIMISGWQVKRIIAIFILNEINMFIFSNQRVIHFVLHNLAFFLRNSNGLLGNYSTCFSIDI